MLSFVNISQLGAAQQTRDIYATTVTTLLTILLSFLRSQTGAQLVVMHHVLYDTVLRDKLPIVSFND
jgi:hypothetical protein